MSSSILSRINSLSMLSISFATRTRCIASHRVASPPDLHYDQEPQNRTPQSGFCSRSSFLPESVVLPSTELLLLEIFLAVMRKNADWSEAAFGFATANCSSSIPLPDRFYGQYAVHRDHETAKNSPKITTHPLVPRAEKALAGSGTGPTLPLKASRKRSCHRRHHFQMVPPVVYAPWYQHTTRQPTLQLSCIGGSRPGNCLADELHTLWACLIVLHFDAT